MAFLPQLLVTLAAVCAVYVAPLRAVNPEGDFRDGLFAPIVVDAREWKMSQLSAAADRGRIDALILGSSRSMQIGPAELDQRYGVRSYNLAVDNAHAEDYLALYHWAKRIGIQPRSIFVGLDLEALHDADKPDERYERNPELLGALGERSQLQTVLDSVGTEVQKYKRMFTPWYVRDAAHSVQVHLSARIPVEIEAMDANGVLRYPRWDAERQSGTFDLKSEIDACIPLYLDRFRDMHGLSQWRRGLLEQLLREARADGVAVVAWLTPVHRATASRLRDVSAYVELLSDASALLSDLGERYGVQVRDLSDPESFGATSDGWYDCAHLDASNIARLVAALPR